MTGTLTAADLIGNSEFVGFCFCWERDRRAPIGFPDWLREQGLEEQAQTADWCLNQPDREVFNYESEWSGVCPALSPMGRWGWYWKTSTTRLLDNNDLVDRKGMWRWAYSPSFPEAIAYLLDHYRPE
jgi:hypothetical protein